MRKQAVRSGDGRPTAGEQQCEAGRDRAAAGAGLSMVAMIALGCATVAAPATHGVAYGYEIERRFCAADAFHVDVAPPPIVLGCRVAGCCPGCVADEPLDLAVEVEGDLPIRLRARIDGEPAAATDLAPGRTVIRGVVAPATLSPAGHGGQRSLRVEASLDAAAIVQSARSVAAAAPFDAVALSRLEVTFRQLQRDRVVAIDSYVVTASPCQVQRPLTDRIELTENDGDDESILLVRGARDGVCVHGEVWLGRRLIYIGNLDSAAACPADLAVFSREDAAMLRSSGPLAPAGPSGSARKQRPAAAPAPAAADRSGRAAGDATDPAAGTELVAAGRQVGTLGWTAAVGERLDVALSSPRVILPLSVRLVAAPSESQDLLVRARFELAVADTALNLSRCGIAVEGAAEILPAPLDEALRADLLRASQGGPDERCDQIGRELARQGPEPAGRVRVLYLADAAIAVFACPEQGIVVLGGLAQPESLAHGLGHLLGLDHPPVTRSAIGEAADSQPHRALGSDNMMSAQNSARRSFTLGQCFAASFEPRSIVNRWKLRAGPIRACGDAAVPGSCPPIAFDAALR